jgi:hypothetical protein
MPYRLVSSERVGLRRWGERGWQISSPAGWLIVGRPLYGKSQRDRVGVFAGVMVLSEVAEPS